MNSVLAKIADPMRSQLSARGARFGFEGRLGGGRARNPTATRSESAGKPVNQSDRCSGSQSAVESAPTVKDGESLIVARQSVASGVAACKLLRKRPRRGQAECCRSEASQRANSGSVWEKFRQRLDTGSVRKIRVTDWFDSGQPGPTLFRFASSRRSRPRARAAPRATWSPFVQQSPRAIH